MKYRCKKCKLEGNVGVCDDKVCVGFNLGSTTTQNDWEGKITMLLLRNFDNNKYQWTSAHAELKELIETLLADARKEVIDEIEKLPRYSSVVVATKVVDGKVWLDDSKNYLIRLDDVLATLRKESK